jgi:hypothetical protein
MSTLAAEIEFRNREQELDHILERLPPRSSQSSITFVRAPSGFGKTRLVDQVLGLIGGNGPRLIVVEPEILAPNGSNRIYAWYFVQRAAAAVAKASQPSAIGFEQFLRNRGIRRVNWRGLYETAKESYSVSKLIKLAFDLGENLLGRNRFHPDTLLKDESSYATSLARDYIELIAKLGPALFVVREAHLIDLESFRFFMTLHRVAKQAFFIFEYTAEFDFLPDHQKLIEDNRSSESKMRIVDLLRLNEKEFLYLLRKYVRDDIEPGTEEFARWNGNLRLVRELKDQVYVERPFEPGGRSDTLESDLRVLIHDRIKSLTNLAKFCLAAVVCHVEALPEGVLVSAARKIEANNTQAVVERAILELVSGSRYIRADNGRLLISDDDVASVILESASFARHRALAERSLREVYLEILAGNRQLSIPLPLAFRESVALCLATGDSVASTKLVRTLAQGGRRAHDQGMYVSLVADALLRRTTGTARPTIELVDWAASAAYEVGDYRMCTGLLEVLPERDNLHEGLLGFCYGEINRHQEGLEIGWALSNGSVPLSPPYVLGQLILIANLFALGRKAEATNIHSRLRNDDRLIETPLYGYVLRFSEILYNFPDCTGDVLQSIQLFKRHGLSASAAYSSLSGAMQLAYEGWLPRAAALCADARRFLTEEFRDLHILLNNEAVIGLFSSEADFQACVTMLDNAAYSVRDDFYRAVIENNRLICYWMLGRSEDALHSVQLLEEIMRSPGFGNRDVFWTFTYNCWAFLRERGEAQRADGMMAFLDQIDIEQLDYEEYWNFRFGRAGRPASKYDHLLRYKYHPEYLSHWLVDADAIRGARAIQQQ